MKVICAWCGREFPDKEPLQDQRISHTMCDACLEKNIKKVMRRRRIKWGNIFGYLLLAGLALLIVVQTVMWLKR